MFCHTLPLGEKLGGRGTALAGPRTRPGLDRRSWSVPTARLAWCNLHGCLQLGCHEGTASLEVDVGRSMHAGCLHWDLHTNIILIKSCSAIMLQQFV
jgi:hypothetical protein